ncbi:membrane-associated phospholipid phosphatase [Streptomyces sp. SAI-208]|uniref:phosphatase PAP2 family protein n=1 Tax=unclassified Streptomyces TaxID=2593676 RepID=UPI00247387A6|nr:MULTISPECIES: phosphatase PAP2 family protein [unclassified Streptomyces]MDH6553095.1 membrane-associated phospholipid phosphatase [Streptomyces sp. SAI-041]MDH6611869.1 membrane-associated phospholipid phosphatase [Streptomyces sp. SAI-208]
MHTPSVDSPPRPPEHRTAARATGVLALCSALLLVLVVARWHPLLTVDGDIADTTHRWAVDEPGLTHAFRILTDWVWDPWAMRLLAAVAAVWLVWRRNARWIALWLVATCALGTLVQQALKAAVGRKRPVWPDPVDTAHFAAYPSGHALTATVVCGLLLWLLHHYGVGRALWRTALALAVISVVGVGLTRIWLGVHWPTDVLGGWLLGAMLVTLAVTVQQRYRR